MNTRIKICGVTNPADALAAVEAGADFLGLNFSEHSPRRITLSQAKAIAEALPGFGGLTGVFVEHSWDEIAAINAESNLANCQFYSNPWPTEAFTPAALIPAFRVKSREDLQNIRALLARNNSPQMIVIDSFVHGAMGGTGHKAPWDLLAGQDFGLPVILAGGLTPENVAAAIRIVKPWGVDVASGVESAPGRKDIAKLKAFVAAVRGV